MASPLCTVDKIIIAPFPLPAVVWVVLVKFRLVDVHALSSAERVSGLSVAVLVRLFVEQRHLVRQANVSARAHVRRGVLQHNNKRCRILENLSHVERSSRRIGG